jgi:Effector Associated Constant Component 1
VPEFVLSEYATSCCGCFAAWWLLGCSGCRVGWWGVLVGGLVSLLRVEVGAGTGADAEELDRLLRGLRRELLELDVGAVEWAAGGPVPAGAKGVGGADAGALVVRLVDSAVFVALAGVLRSWVSRDRGRKVTIQVGGDFLEVTRASEQEQARLIEAFLDSHARQ